MSKTYALPWTFDTGVMAIGAGAPAAITTVTPGGALGDSTQIMIAFISLNNTTAVPILVTLTDGAGNTLESFQVPPGTPVDREVPLMPITGFHAGADVAGATLKTWGWLV